MRYGLCIPLFSNLSGQPGGRSTIWSRSFGNAAPKKALLHKFPGTTKSGIRFFSAQIFAAIATISSLPGGYVLAQSIPAAQYFVAIGYSAVTLAGDTIYETTPQAASYNLSAQGGYTFLEASTQASNSPDPKVISDLTDTSAYGFDVSAGAYESYYFYVKSETAPSVTVDIDTALTTVGSSYKDDGGTVPTYYEDASVYISNVLNGAATIADELKITYCYPQCRKATGSYAFTEIPGTSLTINGFLSSGGIGAAEYIPQRTTIATNTLYQVQMDAESVGTNFSGSVLADPYIAVTGQQPGSYQLLFSEGISNNPITPFNDVVPGSPTGVPEPAIWTIMMLGVCGTGAAVRVNRKRATATP